VNDVYLPSTCCTRSADLHQSSPLPTSHSQCNTFFGLILVHISTHSLVDQLGLELNLHRHSCNFVATVNTLHHHRPLTSSLTQHGPTLVSRSIATTRGFDTVSKPKRFHIGWLSFDRGSTLHPCIVPTAFIHEPIRICQRLSSSSVTFALHFHDYLNLEFICKHRTSVALFSNHQDSVTLDVHRHQSFYFPTTQSAKTFASDSPLIAFAARPEFGRRLLWFGQVVIGPHFSLGLDFCSSHRNKFVPNLVVCSQLHLFTTSPPQPQHTLNSFGNHSKAIKLNCGNTRNNHIKYFHSNTHIATNNWKSSVVGARLLLNFALDPRLSSTTLNHSNYSSSLQPVKISDASKSLVCILNQFPSSAESRTRNDGQQTQLFGSTKAGAARSSFPWRQGTSTLPFGCFSLLFLPRTSVNTNSACSIDV
jgi:hypothetical protein